MKTYTENIEMSRRIAEAVKAAGGKAYYVGGFVRDRIMGRIKEAADIDVEVHGIAPEKLKELLSGLANVVTVGESFGIYSLRSYNIDVAMPRTEKATGRGHRDFETFVDPYIGPEKAASRRDFTINALMEDVLTGEITDCFSGLEDLKAGILRHCNDKSFPEDPLRVLRAAQFAARFDFSVAPETAELCRHISLDTLSCERIEGELKKALLQSDKPSVFFEFLKSINQLSYWFPEVEALSGVEQNPVYHAEGDVWTHTMMVLDSAAALHGRAKQAYFFMLSALCHDFGKPETTAVVDGAIHSIGHELKGKAHAEKFLRRLTSEKSVVKYVDNMLELHMQPNTLAFRNSSEKATNRLFDKALCPHDLILLATADSLGMKFDRDYFDAEPYLWARLEIYNELMSRPAVTGDDLIKAGLKPDGNFKAILAYAHKLHLAGIPKANALQQTLGYARSLK